MFTIEISLSNRHLSLFKAIKQFNSSNGYSPSYRELMDMTDIESLSTINRYLKDLKQLEYIDFTEGVSRSIRLI